MIKKEGDKFVLYSKDGSKKLGEYDSQDDAEAREEQIRKAKHARVNIVSAVNAAKISKSGNIITIKDVVPVVDDVVMNGGKYPGDEIERGYQSLNGTPAPAGHPQDSDGNYISARNAEALQGYWIGAGVVNVRKSGEKVLCDVTINEDQAKAMPKGRELLERCEKAMNGEKIEPIHVSTGLLLRREQNSGESKGKKYTWVARDMEFDHLAILLNERGAGTPEDGVGMWLNKEGQREPVMVCNMEVEAVSKKELFKEWLGRIFGNGELSFSQRGEMLQEAIGGYDSKKWVIEVYDSYFIYRDGDSFYKSDYAIDSQNVVQLLGNPVEVKREVEFKPVNEVNQMKDKITAALNAAGINSAGMSDDDCLAAYAAIHTKPLQEKLTAANEKIAGFELAANQSKEAAKRVIAEKLAVNSSLKVDDFMLMSNERLEELSKSAAPVIIGNHKQAAGDEFDGYSLNSKEA